MKIEKSFLLLFALLSYLPINIVKGQQRESVDYVNNVIGGVGLILEPTRPLAHLPNSMLRVHPLKKDELDDQVSGIPLTVVSHRIGSVFNFLPVSGDQDQWNEKWNIHLQESKPYYYKVVKEQTYNSLEFTPSSKSGFFRITNQNQSNTFHLRFTVINASGFISKANESDIEGEENYQVMKVYFYAKTNGKIESVKTGGSQQQKNIIATVKSKDNELKMTYGISFIIVDKAKKI